MSSEETPAPEPEQQLSINELPVMQPSVPLAPITIDDLLNSAAIVAKKEADDKLALEGIGNMSYDTLKNSLLVWAAAGFPNVYEISRVSIIPPSVCSDGISRELSDYIQFCSGKTIHEHVAVLQSRVNGMTISFANMGGYISVVVSKV